MRKVVRNGKVAVIYSPGSDSGFYTWNKETEGIEELIYLPELVDLIEQGELSQLTIKHVIDKYSSIDSNTLEWINSNLTLIWLPEGTIFNIEDYDGAEYIVIKDYVKWLQA